MKKQTRVSVAMAILIAASLYSCKKSSSTSTPTPAPASTSSAPTPVTGDVDGALISLKVDLTTIVAGYPVTVTTENGIATFFAATGNTSTYVDGGAVSVNTVTLDKQTGNSYIKSATVGQTPADLNFDSNNSNWSVAGNGSVPAFNYEHSVPFPSFSGDIPTSVNRSTNLTITLGSANVTNADSVMIFIVKDSKSITRTFAAGAASATISSADLGILPVVSDNSALIEVIPYRLTMKTEGSKHYAFIKERAVIKNINIQ